MEGGTLTEADMHADGNGALVAAAAAKVATLHAIPVVPPFAPEPLVWDWLQAMLSRARQGPQVCLTIS
jgi:hypothetical protein